MKFMMKIQKQKKISIEILPQCAVQVGALTHSEEAQQADTIVIVIGDALSNAGRPSRPVARRLKAGLPPSYFLPPMSPCLSYNIPTMMEPTCVFKDPMSSPAESTMTLPPD